MTNAAGDVEHRLGGRPSADHVHVHHGLDARREIRPRVEQRRGPFDLRRPEEAQRPRRPRQLPFLDQLLQRPRHLQDGDAAAGVVVRAGPLVVEVAAESDLLVQLRVGAGDGGRDHQVAPGMLAGLYSGAEPDLLALAQAQMLAQFQACRHLGHMLAAYPLRTHPRQFAFSPFRMQQKHGFSHHQPQNRVTEEFQPFVVACGFRVYFAAFKKSLVGQRAVGERAQQQLRVHKLIPECRLQLAQNCFQLLSRVAGGKVDRSGGFHSR